MHTVLQLLFWCYRYIVSSDDSDVSTGIRKQVLAFGTTTAEIGGDALLHLVVAKVHFNHTTALLEVQTMEVPQTWESSKNKMTDKKGQ